MGKANEGYLKHVKNATYKSKETKKQTGKKLVMLNANVRKY